jgi:hypothetical protein
MAAVKRM